MIKIEIDNKFIIKYTLVFMLITLLMFLSSFYCKVQAVSKTRVKDYAKFIQPIPNSIQYNINRANTDKYIASIFNSINSNTFNTNGVLCPMGYTYDDVRNIDFKKAKVVFNISTYSKDYIYEIKCIEYTGKRYIFKFTIDSTASKYKLDRLHICKVYN